MSNNDSTSKTLIVAISLCLVCSIVVSVAAVYLKPLQNSNKSADKQRNILQVVDLLEEGRSTAELFDQYIEAKVVNLETGDYVNDIDPITYDQYKAARDPATGITLSADEDIAGIKRRAENAVVYLVKENSEIKYIILPISGYGLWSTLYGFIALEQDTNTVYGLSFYAHAETPGLGGEVDNPLWKAKWRGKKVYAELGEPPVLEVLKGAVNNNLPEAIHQVDGLAGASLTSRGITNLVSYWLSNQGFGAYLEKIRAQRG